jgi:hypothetical protein
MNAASYASGAGWGKVLHFSIAIHFMHYNFARVHKPLRVTPAMEAGLCDHIWSLEEIVLLAN